MKPVLMPCIRIHRLHQLLPETRYLSFIPIRSSSTSIGDNATERDKSGVKPLQGIVEISSTGVDHRPGSHDGRTDSHLGLSTNKLNWNFDDARLAYKSKRTSEILRAIFVLKCCSIAFFVENNIKLMKLGEKILGRRFFASLMRGSFFGHFVGGEDKSSLQTTVDVNAQFGVKSILHYLFEQNTDKEGLNEAEVTCTAGPSLPLAVLWDQSWENNKKCIDAVADVTKCQGIAAVKLTGLARPEVMESCAGVLEAMKSWFRTLPASDIDSEESCMPLVSCRTFTDRLLQAGVAMETANHWTTKLDSNKDGYLDEGDLTCYLEDRLEIAKILHDAGCISEILTAEEKRYILDFNQTLTALVQYAVGRGVTVVIDAEQTWFQPIIDAVALDLMRRFNRDAANVHTTAQCYRKDSLERAQIQLELSEREGFCLGYRMVRGAYMAQEHQRSLETNEITLHPSYEATSQVYDHIVGLILDKVKSRPHGQVAACVATHNEDSIRKALKKVEELGITPSDPAISFAQLNGMCDYMSFPLGQAGYHVFKSIPYGPIKETLPYLARRANENRSIFEKVVKERALLRTEFGRRLRKRDLFYKPES